MSDSPVQPQYGVTPIGEMAKMPGIDFVRAIFEGRLPEPPIMQGVKPFDCTAEPGVAVLHATPGLQRLQPDRLGARWLRRYSAGLGDGARGPLDAAGGHGLHHP